MKKMIFGCILIVLGLCFPYIYTLFTSFSVVSIILLLSGLFICTKETFPSKNTYQVPTEKEDNKK